MARSTQHLRSQPRVPQFITSCWMQPPATAPVSPCHGTAGSSQVHSQLGPAAAVQGAHSEVAVGSEAAGQPQSQGAPCHQRQSSAATGLLLGAPNCSCTLPSAKPMLQLGAPPPYPSPHPRLHAPAHQPPLVTACRRCLTSLRENAILYGAAGAAGVVGLVALIFLEKISIANLVSLGMGLSNTFGGCRVLPLQHAACCAGRWTPAAAAWQVRVLRPWPHPATAAPRRSGGWYPAAWLRPGGDPPPHVEG